MSAAGSKRAPGDLTDSQQRQLVGLLQASARLEVNAVSVYDLQRLGCLANPLVIGALRDLGLADSQVIRLKGGSQFTAYWLTPAGVERARQLQRAPNG
jgi:hypothetical protein